MPWELNSDRPVYLQLIEQIQFYIMTNRFKAGERLPSVRELAAEAAVNPNTMQKALAELEREGLIFAQRTNGRFITEDSQMIHNLKTSLAKGQTIEFLQRMHKMGLTEEEIIALIKEAGREI